ncbi:MAG: 4-hydroxy-tetrahydrodipicolinate synthase [Flavobacteriales bacterium]|nr:4-hydroxy-tetrahydrodipicolinate synthase [Flavobacteriales bacterium]
MRHNLHGTGIAIVTPFLEKGGVDFIGLEKILNHIIEGGVDYIVVLGTTGESVVLSADEKKAVTNFVNETVDGRKPLVIGIGGNNTCNVTDTIKTTDLHGYDAILSVSPYYNKPTQDGIYQHYKAISAASPIPIILYNVPGRTSSNMSAETTIRLAHDFDNIIGVKEASGDMNQIMKIIKYKPEGFLVISGDDGLTLPMIYMGADGVISVIGQAYPKEFSDMVRYALEGNQIVANKLHYQLLDLLDPLYCNGNPAGIKAALKIMGICGDRVRLPLLNVEKETYQKLEAFIKS